MKKMSFYPTVAELVNHIKSEDISYRNLHTNIYLRGKDSNGVESTISVPYHSVMRDYMNAFKDAVVTIKLDDLEISKYRYKPKRMSNDLYGTPELWSAILELNGCASLIDFTLDKPIKLYDPRKLKGLLNEVMILEKILV